MTLSEIFEEFKKKKIIVFGDVMIDAYLTGTVNRVSPEAPVPIVHYSGEENRLGGAANVALNLISLGASVTMASVIGKDKEGEVLLELLEKDGISAKGIIRSSERQTTVKTRVLGNHQQLLRVDKEQTNDINTEEEKQLFSILEKLLEEDYDALIFQDYNKGTLTTSLIQDVIQLCEKHNVLTTVDPKFKNFLSYKGATLFKPNLKELSEGIGVSIDFKNNRSSFEKAVEKLKETIFPKIVLVTLSEYGVFIENQEEKHYLPAHKRNISDVSGAGDTVISVATLCLCVGTSHKTVAALSNLAGGIVCEYRGVVAIDAEQLFNEAKNKIIELVQ